MFKCIYCWVVLGAVLPLAFGCAELPQWGDIGSPDDMTSQQEQMRASRGIPKATEMPPGLGEDLPVAPPQPMAENR